MNSTRFFPGKFRFCLLAGLLWLSTIAGFCQAPIFTNATIVNGNFQVQILTVSNAAFTIQTSTNLISWTSVGSMTATNNLITLVDNRGLAGFNQQFYRLFLGTAVSFHFNLLEFADAGGFGVSFTPSVTFPVTLDSYAASFEVDGDTNYPAAVNVFFTGPGGSGLTNSPADPDNSNTNSGHGSNASYQSAIIFNPAIASGGAWTVSYKGSNQVFNVSDPQAASRVVVPYPTAIVSGGVLQSVTWVYLDAATGATLAGPPAYMTGLQLQIHGSSISGELYDTDNLTPDITSAVVTSPVNWSAVSGITMAYQDSLGNNYNIDFAGPAVGQ